jgi:MoxR-like ATPase
MDSTQSEVTLADRLNEDYHRLKDEISKVVIGQDEVVKLLITSLFCRGIVC